MDSLLNQFAWVCTEPDTCNEFGRGMLIALTLFSMIIVLGIVLGIMTIVFLIRLIFTKKRLVGQYVLLVFMVFTLALIGLLAEFLGAGIFGLFYGLPVLMFAFLLILATYAVTYSILHETDDIQDKQPQEAVESTEELPEELATINQENQQTVDSEEH